MSGKPLQYDCWGTVLQYMEANVRFQLSRRVPFIRKIEKSVPLRIDRIKLDITKTTINQTTYQLGIYKQYHPGDDVSSKDRNENENGGCPWDVDELEYKTSCDFHPATHGDLDLRTRSWRDTVTELELQRCRDMKSLNELLRKLFAKVMPANRYIQLTVKSPKGTYIERLEYTKKLHECAKYLNTLLFGRHQKRMLVRQVTHKECIVRLPPNLMMIKIRELDMGRFDPLRFREVIDKSSYPLDVFIARAVAHLDHPACQTARKLVIEGKDEWFPRVYEVKNQFVVMTDKTAQFDSDNIVLLIKTWLRDGRSIGACFSMRIGRDTQVLEKVENQFEVISKTGRSVTIPMSDESAIQISYEKEGTRKGRRAKWFLKIEICRK